ncbi:30S ribosomal protein S15, partial [Dysosmobacter welbionis]
RQGVVLAPAIRVVLVSLGVLVRLPLPPKHHRPCRGEHCARRRVQSHGFGGPVPDALHQLVGQIQQVAPCQDPEIVHPAPLFVSVMLRHT